MKSSLLLGLMAAIAFMTGSPASAQDNEPDIVRTVQACNEHDERIYFALGYLEPFGNQVAVEGWWYVEPNSCFKVDVSERLKGLYGPLASNVTKGALMIYGETKLSLFNPIQKFWPGPDEKSELRGNFRLRHCIKQDKDRYFRYLSGEDIVGSRQKDAGFRSSCTEDGSENVTWATNFTQPFTQEPSVFRYTFKGAP